MMGGASLDLVYDNLELLIVTLCLEEIYSMPPSLDPRPYSLATRFRHS